LQRDRRFFPEPEQFNPDRFAPGWEERISRFAYLPFGGDPGMCIDGSGVSLNLTPPSKFRLPRNSLGIGKNSQLSGLVKPV
jgi:hypothetical protein